MLNLNVEQVIDTVITNVTAKYDAEHEKLKNIGLHSKTEGEIRHAAELLVENILQCIFDSINTFLDEKIISKVGKTDYLTKTIEYKGEQITNNKIQVDRHIWYKNKRIAFIENKTYLDACYYDRALSDFKKIAQALEQCGENPKNCAYIVFAGQKAGRTNTLLTYEAEFWYETKHLLEADSGIEPKTYFFLNGTRNSSKPLYKIKHALNTEPIKELVKQIITLL